MEDLWNDPVSQGIDSHKNAYENEQAPTGAQATGIKENSSHVMKFFFAMQSSFPQAELRG
jgi:hypothetical protein